MMPTLAVEWLMRIREVPSDIQARRLEASLLAASSYAARWLHREGDARARIDAAFRLLRDTKDYPAEIIKPGSEADNAARALADHYAETGEPNQAIEAYRDLRGRIMKSNPRPPERFTQCGADLAARWCAFRAAPPRGTDGRSRLLRSKSPGPVATLGSQAAE